MGGKNLLTIDPAFGWLAVEIRRLREDMGISQDVMARVLDINRSTIATIERCGSGASWPLILKIAHFLEMDLNQFLEKFAGSEAAAAMLSRSEAMMTERVNQAREQYETAALALAQFLQAKPK